MSDYRPVIGIETHVQLKTKSKLFCGCDNNARAAKPNSLVCPVCLGLPGSLPYLNKQAIMLGLRVGLALNGQVAKVTKFDRKNYFYPDLPKGYQISQYDEPIIGKGSLLLPSSGKQIGITRAHLEEDAGKLVHEADSTMVDLNRAGTPLMEIVSEPDISSPSEAKEYTQELYNLMRYSKVSDVDLYHGNMRFDVNVSVSKPGEKLGIRTETKNLNSFRSVEKAAEYEIKRQVELLIKGHAVVQETRGWDEAKGKTTSQRGKEEAHDYRYFPEPDIPPVEITAAMVAEAKRTLPELPHAIRGRLSAVGLDAKTVETVLGTPEDVMLLLSLNDKSQVLGIAKYLTGKVRAYRKANPDAEVKLTLDNLAELLEMQASGQVGSSAADEIIEDMIVSGQSPATIAKSKKLLQVSDQGEIAEIVAKVVSSNQQAVDDYRQGNENSLQFLVGQVMKESKGQANPQLSRELLLKKMQP
jgi:aspartyl-tRNA(Asn)/glutamyl-tRNA(Gln) amidotransferase subunit B